MRQAMDVATELWDVGSCAIYATDLRKSSGDQATTETHLFRHEHPLSLAAHAERYTIDAWCG
jgi:hypothetical protein